MPAVRLTGFDVPAVRLTGFDVPAVRLTGFDVPAPRLTGFDVPAVWFAVAWILMGGCLVVSERRVRGVIS